ncbi:helix-turn-helix domain-containing protein [Chloroflexota bacterium]
MGNAKENGGEVRSSVDLGKMLRQQRLMAELTLRQLGDSSGVSSSHLSRIERGERFPSGYILRKIAKVLELDEIQLLMLAGYLSPRPSNGKYSPGQLDLYVAKVLSEEPVTIQRAVVSLLTVVKTIAKSPVGEKD